MRNAGLATLVIGMLLSFTLALAGDIDRTAFYEQSIDKKISQCERKAKLVNSNGKNLQTCGREALEQLRFLENHRDELVREMIENDVPASRQQVNFHLIKAFREHSQGTYANR